MASYPKNGDAKHANFSQVWNHFQAHSPQKKTVIYGHDSKRGLNLRTYSRGLDTNCVRGGKLTALVINENGKEKTYSVNCKNYEAAEKPATKTKLS